MGVVGTLLTRRCRVTRESDSHKSVVPAQSCV